MPARAAEVRGAFEEGVKIEYLVAPVTIMGRKGRVKGLTMIRMRLGGLDKSGRRKPEPIANSEFIRRADTVIVATGQRPHVGETVLGNKFMVDQGGRVNVDTKFSTSHPAVFAAGDVVTGPATVVGSMAQGRQAAARVAEYLMGDFPAWGVPLNRFPRLRLPNRCPSGRWTRGPQVAVRSTGIGSSRASRGGMLRGEGRGVGPPR